MIEYYDLLNEEEQDDMRDLIQLLLRGSGEGVPVCRPASGFPERIFPDCGDHTPAECAYGADLYSGRSIMGREAFKACNDLYSDSEDPL